MFVLFAVWVRAWPLPEQQKPKHAPAQTGKKHIAGQGGVVLFLLFGQAGERSCFSFLLFGRAGERACFCFC